jgi:phage terminase small subunit
METEQDLDALSLEDAEKALKPRQRLFVQHYEALGNATEAVIAAGFTGKDGTEISKESAAVIGSRLLRNVKVLAYMRAYTRSIYAGKNICKESLVLKALRVFDQSMEGTPRLVWDSGKRMMVPDGTWNFDSKGANGAIDIIGKLTGLSEQKIKLIAPGGVEQYLEKLEQQGAEDQRSGEF